MIEQSAPIVVTLLGTGAVVPDIRRFGPATLVEAGGLKLLFDAGRGSSIRLAQADVSMGGLDAIFFTHLHSDHVCGFPDIWLASFLPMKYGNRKVPLHIFGPPGTANMATYVAKTFETDVKIRLHLFPESEPSTRIVAREFESDGTIFDAQGVKVVAFRVEHVPGLDSYGYRIEHRGHCVTLSGDTTACDNLLRYAVGSDLLVHEVFAVQPSARNSPAASAIGRVHISPQQAGMVFSHIKPKLAAYTHVILFGTPESPPPTVDDLERQSRETYDGPLAIGADLMRFTVGDSVQVFK